MKIVQCFKLSNKLSSYQGTFLGHPNFCHKGLQGHKIKTGQLRQLTCVSPMPLLSVRGGRGVVFLWVTIASHRNEISLQEKHLDLLILALI